ncbi:MAG: RagB/SusD family nutrient uptake outer membrane protein [Schleiferiaceae bacterium]|jgi:hypothetical protein
MKKKYLLILVGFGFACLNIQCDSEFIERTPLGTSTVESFYNTEDELVFGINGVYQTFQGDWWGGAFVHLQPHMEGATENGKICCDWEYEVVAIAKGTLNSTTGGFVLWKWVYGYQAISRINQLLQVIENGIQGVDNSDLAKWEGELKFLRGFVYSQLIFHYGDVPLIINPLTPVEAAQLTRDPKEDVLNQVISDFNFAIANLETTPNRGEFGRPTKQAAYAFLGKTYLYNDRWSEAQAAFQEVLNLEGGAVSLDPDFESLFRGKNEQSLEILFSVQYVGQGQVGAGSGEGSFIQTHYAIGNNPDGLGSGWQSLLHTDKMRDAFYMIDGLPIDQSPLYDTDSVFLRRDPRLGMTFQVPGYKIVGSEVVPYSTFRGFPVEESWIVNQGNPVSSIPGAAGMGTKKWVTEFDETSFSDDFSQDLILMRYADVLLMYAEARNENTGPDAQVYNAVNKVRTRAGMPSFPTALSKDEMREEIRHERNVELAVEGIRYSDLIRWRIAETVIPSIPYIVNRSFDPSKNYLWPIPQSTIDTNPNIMQNPNY